MISDEILEKARKLMTLRDRASTPGEAKAAAKALATMLEKYRIEIAQLTADPTEREGFTIDRESPLVSYRRAVGWRRALYTCLCRHYGVAHFRSRVLCGWGQDGRRKFRTNINLCGTSSDMAMVRYMFGWLSSEITRLSKSECSGLGKSFAGSWMLGFVDGIDAQLADTRKEVTEAAPEEVAIVLRRRYEDAREAMRAQLGDLRTVKYENTYRPDAFNKGKRRGEKHHLGKSLDGGHCRALPEAT